MNCDCYYAKCDCDDTYCDSCGGNIGRECQADFIGEKLCSYCFSKKIRLTLTEAITLKTALTHIELLKNPNDTMTLGARFAAIDDLINESTLSASVSLRLWRLMCSAVNRACGIKRLLPQ